MSLKSILRKAKIATALIGGIALAGTGYVLTEPTLSSHKPRILAVNPRYSVPNTSRAPLEDNFVIPERQDNRETLEDSIAKLVISRDKNVLPQRVAEVFRTTSASPIARFHEVFGDDDTPTPGGWILSKSSTRSVNPFGLYTSYNPTKTRRAVQGLHQLMDSTNQRALIFDEGEGGYAQRVGTLPPLAEIANFYDLNIIGRSLNGRLTSSKSKEVRKQQIRKLFSDYATELRQQGVEAVLGPVLDLAQRGDTTSFLNKDDRAASNWRVNVLDLAVEYAQAMHKQGIRIVPKHFPNIGSLSADLHKTASCVSTDSLNAVNGLEMYSRLARILSQAQEGIEGIMISHAGNPNDNCRPYSISPRTYRLLRGEELSENHISPSNTLLLVDEVSMQGVTNYVDNRLTDAERKLLSGCPTAEGRVSALAIRAGADGVIRNGQAEPIIKCIKSVMEKDGAMIDAVNSAYNRWQTFTNNTPHQAYRRLNRR